MDEFDVELRRVVDRLNSLPIERLERAEGLGERCHDVAVLLADATSPAHPSVPMLAPSGWGAELAVLGRDYRTSAIESVDPQVLAALTALRRSLP